MAATAAAGAVLVLAGWGWAAATVDAWLKRPVGPEYARLSEIAPVVRDAVVATEDGKFYRHRGFDGEAIGSAIRRNLEARRVVRGASTLTQQLAKNAFLGPERTWIRKAKEAWLTVELERRMGKDEILERYLNEVTYGPGLRGIGPASRGWFGKPPSELGLAEAAMLAGLLSAPPRHPEDLGRLASGRRTALIRLDHFFPGRYADADLEAADRSLLPDRLALRP